MPQPRFCEQCGAALGPAARFCGQCGSPVHGATAAPAQPRPQPMASQPAEPGEPVLGVIAGAQRRKGLLGHQTFSIVVTPQRLVFAEMTQQMMKDAVRQANEEAKREGAGWLGRIAAQMGWLNVMVRRYQAMPVEQALRERPDNFFVLNSHVRKVTIDEREDVNTELSSYHLVIEATSDKYDLELKAGRPDEARQLLRGVLGAAVR